jgi:C_GCAxxG_C_C family probable redox protein
MLAVGEHLLGEIDDRTLRLCSGLGGGVGRSHQETCGALIAGVLLIGALHGRTESEADDSQCMALASCYRDRFLEAFGSTCCGSLRAGSYGSGGAEPCSVLVGNAVCILLEILEEG